MSLAAVKDEAAAAANDLSLDGRLPEALARIQEAWSNLESTQAHSANVSKDAKERRQKAWELLKSCLEEGMPADATKDKILGKLTRIEQAYQGYTEALALNAEERKDAKESISVAKTELREAVDASKQLTLGFQ